MGSDEVKVVNYSEKYKYAFKEINEEWIKKFFSIEENDVKILNNPDEYIISKGGIIKFALLNGEVVGTCALIKLSHNSYELAKMGVIPKAQGKNIGYILGIEVLKEALKLGAERVELLSNHNLEPALNLYKKLGFHMVSLGKPSHEYKRTDIKMEINSEKIKEMYL